jgi:hypothetical protein
MKRNEIGIGQHGAPADLILLQDRMDCCDAVVGYAESLDTRDWPRFRSLFTDEITLDYGAIGSLVDTIAADDWVARCGLLGFFDATRHRVGNFQFRSERTGAIVTSSIDAAHFITVGEERLYGDLCGTYVHDFCKDAGLWKIRGCRLEVAGFPAGRPAFDAAFAAARAKQQQEIQA